MSSSFSMKTVLVTGSILSFASLALGHMELSWPYALHSKYNPANNYQNIDYSMTSPLVADGSNFPCKGYQNDRPISSVITYQAGSTYNISLAGSATHGGGSCQLSLSYDNGATFRVIKSIIGGCPLTSTYDFTLPSYVPNGDALFAWSWQNEEGNREFYMNCAEVTIQGSSASSKRDTYSSFESLPFIWKANLAGINDCVTIEGDDTVYPEPGPYVEYGGSMSSSSASSSDAGVCDAATPFGQTYEYLSDTPEPQTATSGSGAAAATTKASSSSTKVATTLTKATSSVQSASSSSKAASSSTKAASSATSVKTSSTSIKTSSTSVKTSSTSVASASKQVTLSTVNAGKTSTSTAATAASSTASNDDGDDGDDSDSEGDECADVTLTVYGSTTATSTSSISGTSAAATATTTTTTSNTDSEYATGNLTTYLPCVPGTYICTSSTAWVTCDQTMYSDGSTAWIYEESRSLGNGAVCVPSFSPYTSSNKAYAQQADAPSGYYRDDRIAYTTGQSCTEDGDIECVGSTEFDMCADAVWYQMGATASGTSCSNGALVVS